MAISACLMPFLKGNNNSDNNIFKIKIESKNRICVYYYILYYYYCYYLSIVCLLYYIILLLYRFVYEYMNIYLYRVFQVGMRAFSDGLDTGFIRSSTTAANNAHLPFSSQNSSPRDPTAAVTGAGAGAGGGMTYPDFVYFMLAEEDKTSVPAVKFWFRCCDMDADGRLSYTDMWHFYRVQLDRVASVGQDGANFRDVLCQMLDYLHPVNPLSITIEDMLKPDKRISSGLIFDLLFNMHKFMRFEMRDPFQEKLKREDGFGNDWNRFAYFEYIKLASEEEAAAEQGSNYMQDGDGEDTYDANNDNDNYMQGDSNRIDDDDDDDDTAMHSSQRIDDGDDDELDRRMPMEKDYNNINSEPKDTSGANINTANNTTNRPQKYHHMFYDDNDDIDEIEMTTSDDKTSPGYNEYNQFRGRKEVDNSVGDLTVSAGAIDLSATQSLGSQLGKNRITNTGTSLDHKAEPRIDSSSASSSSSDHKNSPQMDVKGLSSTDNSK